MSTKRKEVWLDAAILLQTLGKILKTKVEIVVFLQRENLNGGHPIISPTLFMESGGI